MTPDQSPERRAVARIRRIRQARGMSAQALSEAMAGTPMSLGRSSIASLEAGQRRLTVDELFDFAQALGVPVTHLLAEGPECGRCNDKPPAGCMCLTCGATAEEDQ